MTSGNKDELTSTSPHPDSLTPEELPDESHLLHRFDQEDAKLKITEQEHHAAGVKAVAISGKMDVAQAGLIRTGKVWMRLNQRHGVDCPSCAWPDPDGHRKTFEFCENGAKAIGDDAVTTVVDAEFFAKHSIADLEERTDYWLGQQGRIAEPMIARESATHYEPLTWDEAYAVIAQKLTSLNNPNEAMFYTSGRASNETAFLFQLFSRRLGTNNLPDCSNMCHEASGTALAKTVGIGKGTVTLEDVTEADLIVVAGQNPGTNHPRMLSALKLAKKNGATIIAVNPLREAGLINFHDPQAASGVIGGGTDIADEFLQIRSGGDMALFQGWAKHLLEADDENPGSVIARSTVSKHVDGFDEWESHIRDVNFADVLEATGLAEDEIRKTGDMMARSPRIIVCWAMGLTQHRHAVATLEEVSNVLLARGMIGRRGAGLCPVRGHSNVQGDRSMGVWEQMDDDFLDALSKEFSFDPPREHGHDVVNGIHAMLRGEISFFMSMGGNFAKATPDTYLTAKALESLDMTVQVSTKLNRSHLTRGKTAIILPTLGRTDTDMQKSGKQFVTVEDSMSVVHTSRGNLKPVSKHLRSEPAIMAELGVATFGADDTIDWLAMRDDYDVIRDHVSRVVPGCEDYNGRVRQRDGFVMPHQPSDLRFHTKDGNAKMVVNKLEWVPIPKGRMILQTMRSHDQFNTHIYGLNDRYRGIHHGRRVILMNPKDIADQGVSDGQIVDIHSEWTHPDTGKTEHRTVERFKVVAYDTPRGNAAAYYPETNPLVMLGNVAKKCNTPASKAVTIRVTPVGV